MRRVSLVSLVGRSPGTLHTVLCLLRGMGVAVEHVDIVATSGVDADNAEEVARRCPCTGSTEPPLRGAVVEKHVLPYSDIDSEERLRDFRARIGRLLRPGGLLDATGGRKAMAIAAVVEAVEKGAAVVVAHIPWEEYVAKAAERGPGDPCRYTASRAVLLHL